jgi:hypothetical protein
VRLFFSRSPCRLAALRNRFSRTFRPNSLGSHVGIFPEEAMLSRMLCRMFAEGFVPSVPLVGTSRLDHHEIPDATMITPSNFMRLCQLKENQQQVSV